MSEVSIEGQKASIKLEKDLVASSVEEFKTEFKKIMNDGATQIILDLSKVRMVDSMGIGIMIATHNSLQKLGNKLELQNVSDEIRSLLRNMRLDKHFQM